jgi:AcrR family transcriptional regulator
VAISSGITSRSTNKNQRIRGTKPGDTDARVRRVASAVRDLERIGAAFTVADVAERSGVSRATIYRTAALRDLVGAKGDSARPVDPQVHARLGARHDTLKTKARELRRDLADTERGWEEMRERALTAERRLQDVERQIAALFAQQKSSGTGMETLARAAAQLSPEALRRARRQIAAVLHPDLFAQDAGAAALATELLKSLNSLTG